MATNKTTEIKTKKNIREDFLNFFVRNLVRLSYKPEPFRSEPLKEQIEIPKHKISIVPISPMMKRTAIETSGEQMMPSVQVRSTNNILPVRQLGQNQISLGNGMSFGKISQILMDPSVFSLECPGPMKNILVNKAGRIQVSSTRLTKEEIDGIMEEISERTRIPVTPGIFKTAYQNVIITAVISEFVGTRFVIQKRNPYRKY